VATVVGLDTVDGFARFFLKFLRAAEKKVAAKGSVRFSQAPICCEES